ncbi:MAG: Asp-tRNA(Asn)/Glu-tRNA(Gln) amidotransferase subunit GatB [Candidatus Aenigmarchaeota archaeon]|nr:Asp-tRNA(Asn)/Glu-tRNA(Gln) amidotransferase subunit GatB [Candidatus Aenigmarchaeota archaeon]
MKAIMGLECHVNLLSKSKLFCSSPTDYENYEPNEATCVTCLGYPGSKPVLNKKIVESALMVAKALNCEISPVMFFSRKSYFYPDMPKDFQITQYEIPIAKNGHLVINGKKIRIRRIQIEEDPGKLIHVGGGITNAQYVLIDYNRAGMPLIEVVTEPDFENVQEVREFLSKLQSILEHLEVYDPGKEASLRIDSNISLEGGERVEVKNITGFADVEKALSYEIVRQQNLVRMGMKIERETRHFDEATKTTAMVRKKETEEDYGYIFEPDLPQFTLPEKLIKSIDKQMPELPDARVKRFTKEYVIPENQSQIIVYTEKALADFFEACVKLFNKPGYISRWIVTDLLKVLNWNDITIKKSKVTPKLFTEFLKTMDKGEITERLGKELIKELVPAGKSVKELVKAKGISAKIDLESVVKQVIKENKKAVEDYKLGNEKAVQFLIGQVLRKTKATGDPNKIKELIKKLV